MRNPFANMAASFWRFGLTMGALIAVVLTLVMTVWEWVENPGGIFRTTEGTQWGFVWDTAMSWFFPTLVYVGGLAALLHLIVSAALRAVRKSRNRPLQ